jgi:hypothetical protein
MTEKSNRAEDWNSRYIEGDTPWERPQVTRRLATFLQNSTTRVKAFVDSGFDVVAIDFAEAAVARARGLLGKEGHRVIQADFFSHNFKDRPFDFVYERTFLTAFPPAYRKDYARILASLLRSGGRLIGYFFHGPDDDPPPYSVTEFELRDLLGSEFKLVNNEPVLDSLPVFEGKERWQEWQRR